MPAAYTTAPSVRVSDFEDIGLLIRRGRLVCGFCSSGQRFACGFLQIPPRGGHPCRPATSSPCRVWRGLAPPSGCALPGASKIKAGAFRERFRPCSLPTKPRWRRCFKKTKPSRISIRVGLGYFLRLASESFQQADQGGKTLKGRSLPRKVPALFIVHWRGALSARSAPSRCR